MDVTISRGRVCLALWTRRTPRGDHWTCVRAVITVTPWTPASTTICQANSPREDPGFSYRWVPVNPNPDNPNSPTIQSPGLLSLQCQSAHLIWILVNPKEKHLYQIWINRDPLVLASFVEVQAPVEVVGVGIMQFISLLSELAKQYLRMCAAYTYTRHHCRLGLIQCWTGQST